MNRNVAATNENWDEELLQGPSYISHIRTTSATPKARPKTNKTWNGFRNITKCRECGCTCKDTRTLDAIANQKFDNDLKTRKNRLQNELQIAHITGAISELTSRVDTLKNLLDEQ